MGQVKNNEVNLLQNGLKIIYLLYPSTSFFPDNMGKTTQQNSFPVCNIFELPHYF